MKSISYRSGKFGKFLTVFGFTFAVNPWGNCFSPALILNTNIVGIFSLTFRSSYSVETCVYYRGGIKFDWNSGHLARRFGKFIDTDFGGFYKWRNHVDL